MTPSNSSGSLEMQEHSHSSGQPLLPGQMPPPFGFPMELTGEAAAAALQANM